MTPQDIIKNVQRFIALIEHGIEGDLERELRISLDLLALSANYSDGVKFDSKDYPDAPPISQELATQLAKTRFPNLGLYNIPCEVGNNIAQTEVMVGDAQDDIQDIYKDMKEVSWLWQHNSPEDGLWQFNWGWQHHWGAHLRNLQWYLFMSRNEGSR